MYENLVGTHGIASSEYWGMTPTECWLVVSAKIPPRQYGNMSGDDFDRLRERREELEAQGINLL